MQLPAPESNVQLKHFSTISHEGKILIFAVNANPDPTKRKIFYTVRRDGFEESKPGALPDWENWKQLDLPNEAADLSVVNHEAKFNVVTNTVTPEPAWLVESRKLNEGRGFFARSVYNSGPLTADGPVQLVSAFEHLYVFRSSIRGPILVDRFVLDGLTNLLIRKLDVRYKRSRKRHEPFSNGPSSIDALDFRDANGQAFHEPSIALSCVNRVEKGNFDVVLTPTAEQELFRWHIFAVVGGVLELVTLRATKEGLFDFTDRGTDAGLQRRFITIQKSDGAATAITGSIAARRYDEQTPTAEGKLMRDSIHVMLAVPTAEGVVMLSFAVTGDGTLAQVATNSTTAALQQLTEDTLLPPDELERVVAKTAAPALAGDIGRISVKGGKTSVELDGAPANLPLSGLIRIDGSANFNGRYRAEPVALGQLEATVAAGGTELVLTAPLTVDVPAGSNIDVTQSTPLRLVTSGPVLAGQNLIPIEPSPSLVPVGRGLKLAGSLLLAEGNASLGRWEILPGTSTSDNSAARLGSLARTADGRLVTSGGDLNPAPPAVRIAGATGLDGVFVFRRGTDGNVEIQEAAGTGQLAVALAPKRPGLEFETDADFVEIPGLENFSFTRPFAVEAFIRTTSDGVILARSRNAEWEPVSKALAVINGKLALVDGKTVHAGTITVTDGQLHHVACLYTPGSCRFMVDGNAEAGALAVTLTSDRVTAGVADSAVRLAKSATTGFPGTVAGWRGTLAEVRLWDTARTPEEVRAAIELDLTGRETGLLGYWRLGGVVDGESRLVADFAAVRHDGTIHGQPFAGEAELRRSTLGQLTTVGFENAEPFIAAAGGTYEETFEFRVVAGTVDPLVTQPFALVYSGRRDSNSVTPVTFAEAAVTEFSKVDFPAGSKFFRAKCRFTVPDGVSLVRSFAIGNLAGDWSALRIRRHSVRLVASSVTEQALVEKLKPVNADSTNVTAADKALREFTEAQLAQARLQRELNLLSSLNAKIASLARKIGNPRNYWFRIREATGDFATGFTPNRFLRQINGTVDLVGSDVDVQHDTLFGALPIEFGGQSRSNDDIFRSTADLDVDSTKNFAIVIASRRATQQEMLAVAGFQTLETEKLPLALRRIEGGNTIQTGVLLDQLGLRARLSPESAQLFDRQKAAEAQTPLYQGIPEDQLWRVEGEDPINTSIVGETGDVNFKQPIRQRRRLFVRKGDNHGKNFAFEPAEGLEFTSSNNGAKGIFFEIPKIDLGERNPEKPDAEETPEAGRPVSAAMRKRLRALNEQLKIALAEAQKLGMFPDSGQAALRTTLTEKLNAATAQVIAKRSEYLAALGNSTGSLEMGKLSSGTDPRVLGVSLKVAKPIAGSRLSLTETSDGKVALHFPGEEEFTIKARTETQEKQFRLRQMSMDTKGQSWETDSLRRAITLKEPIGVQGLSLGADWTFECWMLNPLPGNSGLNGGTLVQFGTRSVFLRDDNGDQRFGIESPSRVFFSEEFDFSLAPAGWHHVAVVARGSAKQPATTFYVDGVAVAKVRGVVAGPVTGIGDKGIGPMAEMRLWNVALGDEELATSRLLVTSGQEPGLVLYVRPDPDMRNDAAGRPEGLALTFKGDFAADSEPFPLPVGVMPEFEPAPVPAVLTIEYPTYSVSAAGDRSAIMRRCLAYPSKVVTNGKVRTGLHLFGDKRVDELELVWTGNAQFAPTLLGYIEGAPPVPSENLTENEDGYDGATSVTLSQSDEVELSWTRSKENAYGGTFTGFGGVDQEAEAGAFVFAKVTEIRAGVTAAVDFSLQRQAESSVTFSSTLVSTDTLALKGAYERRASLPELGRRWVPKNAGYALVISALADVFVTRLKNTGRMVSYVVVPTPDVPPEINTITFLVNPAYARNGSLDGLVGTHAADDRFFRDVPEMRARLGGLYPASYMRLKQAFELKRQIQEDDKRRETFFQNFDTRLATVFDNSVETEIDKGAAPAEIGVPKEDTTNSTPAAANTDAKLDLINQKLDGVTAGLRDQKEKAKAQNDAKREEIQKAIPDPAKQSHALAAFEEWQKKMEDIRVRAGKRNIVNTYVWDADGGLRAEQEQFASTVEHTIGSTASLDASVGFDFGIGLFGAKVELAAAATFHLTQTLSKKATTTRTLGLEVDLSGVESQGITDTDDLPLLPGEKVGRYRFMSFYLEKSVNNFNEFFSQVVDPEWLASNSEEARALRQTRAGKPNAAWRVLHRVTYVERPALMGFGRDVRPLRAAQEPELRELVESLREENQTLRGQVAEVLDIVKAHARAAAAGN